MNPLENQSPPNRLLEYIRSEASRGVPQATIYSQLSATNWSVEQIETGFATLREEAADSAGNTPAASVPTLLAGQYDARLQWLFKWCMALLFIANGLMAWLNPTEFVLLLQTFPLATWLGHIELIVLFIGFHDLMIGALILSGLWYRAVWAWAGVWLGLVAFVKFISLLP